jgi:hypothetical protein
LWVKRIIGIAGVVAQIIESRSKTADQVNRIEVANLDGKFLIPNY